MSCTSAFVLLASTAVSATACVNDFILFDFSFEKFWFPSSLYMPLWQLMAVRLGYICGL